VVISGFEWDDENIVHIGRHKFTPEEVEEVFAGNHKVRRAGQKRYVALGETFNAAWLSWYFADCPEVSSR